MTEIYETEAGMRASMECWNAAYLEAALDLETCTYILTVVVVMIADSNTRHYKG